MKEKNFVSLVVYLRNAQETAPEFLFKVDALMREKFEAYEFVLVNDYSTDQTKEKIREIADDLNGNVILIDLAWKHKLELAMLAGVDMAIGDFIYEFESTVIDYDLNVIWETYEKAMTGYDIVSVSSDQPLKFTSKLFYSYLNKVSYRHLELTTETFKLISRRALNRILKSKEKLRYRKALYQYAGFESTTLKYNSTGNQSASYDHMPFTEKLGLATDVLIAFSNVGLRISATLSLIFFFISLFVGGYTVYSYLTLNEIATGWTTIMLFLSISFTGMFFVLAFLSKYMTSILVELQDRPNYTYRGIERLSRK